MKKVAKFMLCLLLGILTILIVIYSYAYFDKLQLNEKRNSITLYDVYGDIMYESNFKKNMKWVKIDKVPKKIQTAFVKVEDKRFYEHAGFDPIRLTKAFLKNIKNQEILEGGSTITQQYAKNLFLSNEQTITRKWEEFFYATRLEMQYSKAEILEGYLNTLYFGHGIYGIESAANFFFDQKLNTLSNAQIAMLVGIPNGPAIYSPFISMKHAMDRQHLILNVLYHNEVINQHDYKLALKEKIVLASLEKKESSGMDEYYIDSVIHELKQRKELDLSKAYHVYTYYDPSIQTHLNTAIKNQTTVEDSLQIAGVIIQPFSGAIIAIAGGKDYTFSQFNRAIYSKRQIASTIKPLLYYNALIQGFTPSTPFLSAETKFKLNENQEYAPSNYASKYANADISMIDAIALSDNIYAIKTHLFLGVDTLSNALHDFGIKQALPHASLALGTIDLSILELSTIYNTFASEGLYTSPSFISSIVDESGEVILKREVHPKRLLQRDETLILNQLLTSTYDVKTTNHTVPTLIDCAPKIKVAGKSGTSEWDSLIVGYNPSYTIGIWSGYDDNQELDKKYYGVPKKIWRDTWNALYKNKEGVWYQPSDHIIKKIVDPISGKEDRFGSEYWYLRSKEDAVH
ncbi:MAG: transglycosylase domain-containing protein [Erysipelotrichaceae bacterium]